MYRILLGPIIIPGTQELVEHGKMVEVQGDAVDVRPVGHTEYVFIKKGTVVTFVCDSRALVYCEQISSPGALKSIGKSTDN